MKPGVVRQLAAERSIAELEVAVAVLSDGAPAPVWVDGTDDGERLTHVLLAVRIRRRIDDGMDPKEAFRTEMTGVRAVLQNE